MDENEHDDFKSTVICRFAMLCTQETNPPVFSSQAKKASIPCSHDWNKEKMIYFTKLFLSGDI